MLKVGTVFSGIGAVEHALERMGIDFEIEFACDNGDVDIISKKVNENINSIRTELKNIKEDFDDIYETDLIIADNELKDIISKINEIDVDFPMINNIYTEYKQSDKINTNQSKAYEALFLEIKNNTNANEIKIIQMKLAVKLESDIKRSNLPNEKIKKYWQIVK